MTLINSFKSLLIRFNTILIYRYVFIGPQGARVSNFQQKQLVMNEGYILAIPEQKQNKNRVGTVVQRAPPGAELYPLHVSYSIIVFSKNQRQAISLYQNKFCLQPKYSCV